MALTPLTDYPDRTTQTQTAFNSSWSTFFPWLQTFATEVNITADLINTKAADVAAAVTTVAIWVSGAAYTSGNVRYSPSNWQNYRRKTTSSAGVTDPSVDTTNWAPIVSLASLTLTGTTTLDVLVGTSTTEATSSTAAGTKFASGLAVAKKAYIGGIANLMAGAVFSGGASAAATIWQGAANGLQIRGSTGSGYDLVLYNGAGAPAISVLAGTTNVEVAGNIIAGAGILHKTYTVATRPAHAAGNVIFVSDGGAGAVFQGSTGAAWVNLG